LTHNAQPKASHFINGEYVEDSTGSPIDVIYPATGKVIARVYAAAPPVSRFSAPARSS
jgi:betaine-aldehyde dehydrogenase